MKTKRRTDADILVDLAREKGLKGVRQQDAEEQLPLDPDGWTALAGALEEEGRVRVLSFAPLFLVSRESVEFLGQKILSYVAQFHKTNPKEAGLTLDRLKKRFDAPSKILRLAALTLVHDGRLKQEDGLFALSDFRRRLPLREEQLLGKLESSCFEGEIKPLTAKDMLERLPLTPQKLGQLLDILIERKRIAAIPSGFYVSAAWLDGLIDGIRSIGKKELSIAQFKSMTGFSRKFAIPLLEYLDEQGVTRRTGSAREIL